MIEKLIKRYRLFLLLGILIIIISFGAGVIRTLNEATLQGLIMLGDTTSDAYRAALTNEALLMRYAEIVPLFGLGLLKLGIGFAIATIVTNLKSTGENAGESLAKVNRAPSEMKPPLFARIFPMMLVLGILAELVAVLVAAGWMATGIGVIDLTFAAQDITSIAALDHLLEILAEPLEGLGVSLLIGGIAFGLATIVVNLGRQATILPKILTELTTGKESSIPSLNVLISKPLLILTLIGILVTASGLIPIAFIRMAVTIPVLNGVWETWMFTGIAILLFSIGFWLLTIIQRLKLQKTNLGKTVAEVSGLEYSESESTLTITKMVPVFLFLGLVWMLSFLVLSFLTLPGEALASYRPLVRPGKAIGLAIIFVGIGLSLITIVINLRLTAFMLPGAFSRIVSVIKGEQPQAPSPSMASNPMLLAPRKLFVGIIIGVIIVVLGTFPLAWMRIGASTIEFLMIEHMIGAVVSTGVGLIFFFIGMFFSIIVSYVKARRQIISEGVESCVLYSMEKQ
ncbi:MAG: hypothetical protein ACTSU3_05755 [Candidatus Thorarchaeota archaeon]